MPTDHHAQVAELLADYQRSRDQLGAVQREIAEIAEQTHSEDGTVTVTVGAQGGLRDLRIADEAYQKHQPAELASMILALTGQATRAATSQVEAALESVLPTGSDPAATVAGSADLEPVAVIESGMDDAAGAPQAAQRGSANDEVDDDLSETSWLEGPLAKRSSR